MPSAFENDLQDLAKRFAHDLVARARRASLAELAQALGAKAPSSWERRYGLTEAQSFILEAAVSGKTRAEISRARGTSPTTIKKQVHELLAKTGDPSLLAATTRLLREGGRVRA